MKKIYFIAFGILLFAGLVSAQNDTIYLMKSGAVVMKHSIKEADIDSIIFYAPVSIGENATDIDGNVYKTVKIGNQIWMAENLRVTHFNDGAIIPLVTENTVWKNLRTPGYCWYFNNETSYKNTYGAMYNWYSVNTGKLAPDGWHVASDADWITLTNYLGDVSVAGGMLKETGTSHWWSPNTGATNITGFTALPGGHRGTGNYMDLGGVGVWWTTTEISSDTALAYVMAYNADSIYRQDFHLKLVGFSVRCVKNTISCPVLTTNDVTNIGQLTATSGGTITSDGGAAVTARGVCWSTNQNPTIADSKTTDGTGTGEFTSSITGLTANTTYYIRAYATNSVGTCYGEEISFKTLMTIDLPKDGLVAWYPFNGNANDESGNGYNGTLMNGVLLTSDINNNENSAFNFDGIDDFISLNLLDPLNGASQFTLSYWINTDLNFTGNPYGNYGTVFGHWSDYSASSEAIGFQLTHLNDRNIDVSFFGGIGTKTESKIIDPNIWNHLTVVFDGTKSSEQRVSLYKNGAFIQYIIVPDIQTTLGTLATRTYIGAACGPTGAQHAWSFFKGKIDDVGVWSVALTPSQISQIYGTGKILPTITTNAVTNIGQLTATSGGTITSDGGAAVTARGVCWSTNQNPTIADSKTTDGTGTGEFTSSITGLTPNTTYYIRAYATNSVGTCYGEELSFKTKDYVVENCGTVTDIDGNVYQTVKIGNQCWMAENLRTTKYRNGDAIPNVTASSEWVALTTGAWCVYNNNASYASTYGLLYNWYAVGDTRGLAPEGWHVASTEEWQTMANYLIANGYNYDGSTSGNKIGKAVGTTENWISSSYPGGVGNNQSSNNKSGFSIPPGGGRQHATGDYFVMNYHSNLYTSTEVNATHARMIGLYFDADYLMLGLEGDGAPKYLGASVRCVKD